MFSSSTRVVILIGACTFALTLLIIVFNNSTNKEIIIPLITAAVSYFGGFVNGFFQGRKNETDLPVNQKDAK